MPAATRLTSEQRRLAEAMIDDIAQAVLRTRLVSDLEDARVAGETERPALGAAVVGLARSALAAGGRSSARHPALNTTATQMDAKDRADLLDTIRVEGERLDRYIQNLLDMTRLGHGGWP